MSKLREIFVKLNWMLIFLMFILVLSLTVKSWLMKLNPYFEAKNPEFVLFLGDNLEILPQLDVKFDMVFADPPYFLSNDGLTVQNGKIVSVNKGDWDKAETIEQIHQFNLKWLEVVKQVMKDNATIWISGTMHNIFSIGLALQQLDFKILNTVIWKKTNPPPNFSKRYFTHSSEIIIWARKDKKQPHKFNYDLMKSLNAGRAMHDVWELPAIAKYEKNCGKHPTQKPLALLARIILASTDENDWILDPFTGSSSTGIAANLYNRNFVGIDINQEYLEISKCRRLEIDNPKNKASIKTKIEKSFSKEIKIFG